MSLRVTNENGSNVWRIYIVNDSIKIDTSLIPNEVANDLADATLDLIYGILQQPGGREALEARVAAKRATRKQTERS